MTRETAVPHVVMLVGNDVRNDARVKKSAVSVRRHGYRVTVVGRSSAGVREEATMADVALVRVPVPFDRRARAAATRDLPSRWWRTEKAARNAAAAVAARRAGLPVLRGAVIRRLGRAGGPVATVLTTVADGALWLAGEGIRVHRGLQRRIERRRGGGGRRAWRRDAAAALDYADHMVAEVVELQPDVIHAHDVNMLLVADRAISTLVAQGRTVRLVYDAHELVSGLSVYQGRGAHERAAWHAIERRLAPTADAMVTVSGPLAEVLEASYRPRRPVDVVPNAPWRRPAAGRVPGVRAEVGLAPDVPLLVYSGGMTEARGVDTALEALTHLPDVHLVVVPTPARGRHVTELVERAAAMGLADRFHVAAPVDPDDVVGNLRSADLGLIPLKRFPSHDVALTNKLFEYLHAGLPVVVSDCPVQAEFVTRHGVGTVHGAADARSLAAAVRDALDRRAELAAAVGARDLTATWSWQESERVLGALYRDLLPAGPVAQTPGTSFPRLVEDRVRTSAPSVVVARGHVASAVAAELVGRGLRLEDDLSPDAVVLVDVETLDDGTDAGAVRRRGAWRSDVVAAQVAGATPVAVVTSDRLATPWPHSTGPTAERLELVADRAALRALEHPVVTASPALARLLPDATAAAGSDAPALAEAVAATVGIRLDAPSEGAA